MITKHKIFKIPLEGDSYEFDGSTMLLLDDFLRNPNYVYIGHSTTSLGQNLSRASNEYREAFIVISLIYKDLADSPMSLSNVSEKTKKIVRKSVESGQDIEMPKHVTDFEKRIKKSK